MKLLLLKDFDIDKLLGIYFRAKLIKDPTGYFHICRLAKVFDPKRQNISHNIVYMPYDDKVIYELRFDTSITPQLNADN